MRPIHVLFALIVITVWGLNFIAVKVAVTQIPPLFTTGLRFALVAALIVPFLKVPREQLKALAILSLTLGVCHFGVLFIGFRGVDVAVAAVALQLGVPFSAILAWVMMGDKFGWRRAVGMAIAFGGVAVIAGEPEGTSKISSLVLVIAAAFAWAFANIQIKRLGEINVFALNGWMALFATPQVLILSLVFETGQIEAARAAGWDAWAGFAFMAFGSTLFAYGLWYHLLKIYDVGRIVPFNLLTPVIGVVAGILVLGETASVEKLIGGAMTIAGVAVIQLRWTRPAEPAV